MTKQPYGEARLKFDIPVANGDDMRHPGVEAIRHAQQQAFLEVATAIAAHDAELIASIQSAIQADAYLGGEFYTRIEAISPGITPRIGERMDQLIQAAAERHSAWTSLGMTSQNT